MADNDKKAASLSIVLRTVDKATADLQRINARITTTFKPFRDLTRELGTLSKNIGLPKLGSAMAGVGREVRNLTLGFAAFGALAVGVAGRTLLSWAGTYDVLAKSADRIGMTVDGLAQLQYAANLSGVETQEFSDSLDKMSKNLGEVRSGTSALYKDLKKNNPQLLKQLEATKGNEEAFLLFADSIASISDPSIRAARAQAVFGRSGMKLINMLASGSPVIRAQMAEYFRYAGSQEKAARASEALDDSLTTVKASFDSVKAAVMVGLGPAFTELATTLANFFAENRVHIEAWMRDFGEKLPGHIASLSATFKEVWSVVKDVWEFIGGAKGAVVLLAAAISANLLVSIGGLIVSLGTVTAGLYAAATAAGAAGAVGAVGAVGAAGAAAMAAGGALVAGAGAVGYGVGTLIDRGLGLSDKVSDVLAKSDPRYDTSRAARGLAGIPGYQAPNALPSDFRMKSEQSEAFVLVKFENAPAGTRVTTEADSTADVATEVKRGPAMVGL